MKVEMKTKIFLLWAILIFAFTVTSCKNDGNEPELVMKTLADSLIGEWKLVKISGGIHGKGAEIECSEVLKIFGQNNDLSFNYELWKCDTLFKKSKIVLRNDRKSIFGTNNRVIDMFIVEDDLRNLYSFVFHIERNNLYVDISMEAYDAYGFTYKKTKNKFN